MTTMKLRLKGAKTGHSLLKKKADAMQMKFRGILKKIIDVITEFHIKVNQIISIHYSFIDQNLDGRSDERSTVQFGRSKI